MLVYLNHLKNLLGDHLLSFLGCFLVFAGALKLFHPGDIGLSIAIGRDMSSFVTAGIIAELLLGILLIIGIAQPGTWILTLFTFLCFTAISLTLVYFWQVNCGCFGAVKTSPWISLTLNLIIVTILICSRPLLNTFFADIKIALPIAVAIGSRTVACLGLVIMACWFWFGSVNSAMAHLSGETVLFSKIQYIGSLPAGISIEYPVLITNNSDRPVVVIGGTSDCNSTAIINLPATLMAYESKDISILVNIPNKSLKRINIPVKLWVNSNHLQTIHLNLIGFVN